MCKSFSPIGQFVEGIVSVKMELICVKLTKEQSSIIVEPIFKFILEQGSGVAQAGLRLTIQLMVTMSSRSFLFHLSSDGVTSMRQHAPFIWC